MRRKGRDRRIPQGSPAWAITFAQSFGLDWLIDPSLNVTLATSPDVSIVGDVVGSADLVDNGDATPDLIPNDPDFGGHSALTFDTESVASSVYTLLSTATEFTVLVAGALQGYFFSSDSFDFTIRLSTDFVELSLGGPTNYVRHTIDPRRPFILHYDGSQTGFDKVDVYQDGVAPQTITAGTLPSAVPTLSASLLAGRIASTYGWGTLAMVGIKIGALSSVAQAWANMAARFAPTFWGSPSDAYTVGKTVYPTTAVAFGGYCHSKVAIAGDCVAAAKQDAVYDGIVFGLTSTLVVAGAAEDAVEFGWKVNTSSTAIVRESGSNVYTHGAVTPSDRLTVTRSGSAVTYQVNGSTVYTSAASASGSYYAIFSPRLVGEIITECDFAPTSPAAWEDTHAATYDLGALYTADSGHVLESADSHVERLHSWVGNLPVARIPGDVPPIVTPAQFGALPGIVFSGGGLEVDGLAAIMSGKAAFTLYGVFDFGAPADYEYVLSCNTTTLFFGRHLGGRVRLGNAANYNLSSILSAGKYVVIGRYDGSQATPEDRIQTWVNGVNDTDVNSGTIPATWPALSTAMIGRATGGTAYALSGTIGLLGVADSLIDPATLSAALNARFGVYTP